MANVRLRVVMACVVALLLSVLGISGSGVASAAASTTTPVNYGPGAYTVTVPVGAKIAATLYGAAGAFNCDNSPGNGAEIDVTFIAQTTSLTLSVGAAGGGSAGGGAATSISLPDGTLVAIAGGGGSGG